MLLSKIKYFSIDFYGVFGQLLFLCAGLFLTSCKLYTGFAQQPVRPACVDDNDCTAPTRCFLVPPGTERDCNGKVVKSFCDTDFNGNAVSDLLDRNWIPKICNDECDSNTHPCFKIMTACQYYSCPGGSCASGYYCSNECCLPEPCQHYSCPGGSCPSGYYCSNGCCLKEVCQPDCVGKSDCAADGCGGICCPPGRSCVDKWCGGITERMCIVNPCLPNPCASWQCCKPWHNGTSHPTSYCCGTQDCP